MTADEIRSQIKVSIHAVETKSSGDFYAVVGGLHTVVAWSLGEIAAQLAELNENLRRKNDQA